MAPLLDKLWGAPADLDRASEAGPGVDDRRLRETMPSDIHPTEAGSRPPTFTYPPGSTPLPRYTIRRGIGVGGFGEVYFAVSEAGKEVALKRVQRNLEVELRGVSQCLNLKHPHLVALHDVCHDDTGQAWVVMEYIPGPSLREVLDESPRGLPPSEVRRWFAAIGSAVAYLHASGLVHRDLKPGNVFDDLGIVKVGDYGLSKFISASHRGGHTESVGTFHYMAPEIGRGEYGREIDIYALGIVLYELLTGRVPFDGESCHEIIVKHLTAEPDLTEIEEPYRSAVARALRKDPEERPRDVAELFGVLGIELTGYVPVGGEPRPGASGGDRGTFVAIPRANGAAEKGPSGTVPGGRPAAAGANRKWETATSSRGDGADVDEPLARAVRNSYSDLQHWWRTLDRSPGAKAFVAFAVAIMLVMNTGWLLPLLSLIGVVYVPYYIIRQMVLHSGQQPSYAEAQRVATAQHVGTSLGVPRRPVNRSTWKRQMRSQLRAKPSIDRLAELATSWVASGLTVALLAFVSGVIGLRNGPVDAVAIAPYVWIAVVVLIGSAGLLGLGKLWERGDGESLPRRMVLAGIGAGVGLVAYSAQQFLLIPADIGLVRDIDATSLPQTLYGESGPRLSAWVVHFGLLFAMLRWWKLVDPLRRSRLGLWGVAVAVVGEWLLHQFFPVPQPYGMLVAGGIAVTIQMSAPWTSPELTQIPVPARRAAARQNA